MQRNRFIVFAFALLLFAVPIFAEGPTTFQQIWGENGENWGAVATVAVLLSILFAALAYMAGLAFRQPRLTIWAKNEIYQALASAFIFAFILGFVVFLSQFSAELSSLYAHKVGACSSDADCGVSNKPCTLDMECSPWECVRNWRTGEWRCGNGYQCLNGNCAISCETLIGPYSPGDASYHIRCARRILSSSKSAMVVQADQILNVNMRIQMLIGLGKKVDISPNLSTMPIFPTEPIPAEAAEGISFSMYAGASMLGDAIGYIFSFMSGWIVSFLAQEFFLRMVQDALFPILLALGLILRTFFFTRRLGGLLIAVAIGLYTIYPLMYILLADQFIFADENIWYDRWNFYSCFCDNTDPWWVKALALVNPAVSSIIYTVRAPEDCPIRLCASDLLLSYFLPTPMPINIFQTNWLFALCESVGRLMVPALFIPVVIIIVTVSFIKGLSPLLGGDVEIAGLTHLI